MALISRENLTCQMLSESTPSSDASPEADESGSSSSEMSYRHHDPTVNCLPDFDKSLCWYNVSLGSIGRRQCPFTFCPSVSGCESVADDYNVNRRCHENGTWGDSVYTACIDLLKSHSHCIVGYCRTCPDLLRETVINVSLTLSVISVGVLVSALILFSMFDSIQCRRLSIHKNLAMAFVLRFAVLAIWTVVNTSNAFRDCTHFNPIPLRNWEWLCKAILWLVIYFQVASVMWMLIEGLYLYTRFTVFGMRRTEAPYCVYLLSGWGIPFVVVCSWTIVHEYRSRQNRNSFCWLPYAQGPHLWILAGTMGVALILNVLFLLAIVLILVQKLRTESAAESKKIWRAVKATILLVPLLGISNIPLFYEPAMPSAIYMLGSAILQHSQGIFIAVLYCFLNGEIQHAVRRHIAKAPLFKCFRFLKVPTHYETERTYVPGGAGENGRRFGTPPTHNDGDASTAGSRTPNGYGRHRGSSSAVPMLSSSGGNDSLMAPLTATAASAGGATNYGGTVGMAAAAPVAPTAPREDLLLVVLDAPTDVDGSNADASSPPMISDRVVVPLKQAAITSASTNHNSVTSSPIDGCAAKRKRPTASAGGSAPSKSESTPPPAAAVLPSPRTHSACGTAFSSGGHTVAPFTASRGGTPTAKSSGCSSTISSSKF